MKRKFRTDKINLLKFCKDFDLKYSFVDTIFDELKILYFPHINDPKMHPFDGDRFVNIYGDRIQEIILDHLGLPEIDWLDDHLRTEATFQLGETSLPRQCIDAFLLDLKIIRDQNISKN